MDKHAREIDQKLVRKYNYNAYMYVEYPHKSYWSRDFGEGDYKEGLKSLFSYKENAPVLLYVHMPYCQKQCSFCTCRVEISSDYQDVKNYLEVLHREIDLYVQFFRENGIQPNIQEIHLGGGTPTYLYPEEFERLMEKLKGFVNFDRLAEFSIEIDPRRVKKDRMEYYHKKGINRISFGIQDFDVEVQKAVNRVQPASIIEKLLTPEVRALFPHGINFDIICGLPHQTTETIRRTMEKVVELAPDRVCVNYLDYAPQFAQHQLLMPTEAIPVGYDRKKIFLEALEVMERGGYLRTGYDHFAKPTDDVARAMGEKKMIWNSLGVTPGRCEDILGIGVHSYSRLGPHYYSQNLYGLDEYYAAVRAGRFPVFRGCRLSDDDILRRDVIQTLRSYFFLDFAEVEKRTSICFQDYFKDELAALDEFEKDGIVVRKPGSLAITELGQQFANLVCRNFDRYVRQQPLNYHPLLKESERMAV